MINLVSICEGSLRIDGRQFALIHYDKGVGRIILLVVDDALLVSEVVFGLSCYSVEGGGACHSLAR